MKNDIIKNKKMSFLPLLPSSLWFRHSGKPTAQTAFFHVKICLMHPPLYCKMHSRWHHHSLMPDTCKTLRHTLTACQISNKHKVCCGRPLSSHLSTRRCSWFYSATWPDWFCSASYAELPAAVIKHEIRVACFRQVAPCVLNLMSISVPVLFHFYVISVSVPVNWMG